MCARCPDLETKVNKGRGNSTVRAHVRVFSVENGEFEIWKAFDCIYNNIYVRKTIRKL